MNSPLLRVLKQDSCRKLVVWWKKFIYRSSSVNPEGSKHVYTRWEQDYNLQNVERLDCLDEYLEMGKTCWDQMCC